MSEGKKKTGVKKESLQQQSGVEEVVDMRGGWADPDLWK